MNRNSLWVVVAVASAWISFLLGFAVSAHSGAQPLAAPKAASGGYGCVPEKKPAQPGAQEAKKGSN